MTFASEVESEPSVNVTVGPHVDWPTVAQGRVEKRAPGAKHLGWQAIDTPVVHAAVNLVTIETILGWTPEVCVDWLSVVI